MFDAGSMPDGVPYFDMEYVAGVPTTTYCDDHRLSMRDQLELLRHVCQGVRHAHQKAILHRDLKPSGTLKVGLVNCASSSHSTPSTSEPVIYCLMCGIIGSFAKKRFPPKFAD
jgi:serine/threonine protein kinase